MDPRLFTSNVLPQTLLSAESTIRETDPMRLNLASRDLVALSSGHDFLIQASNPMCADAAFASLHLPWITGQLDAQAVVALRTGGASFTSRSLQQAVTSPIPASGAAGDVLLLFSTREVMFDAPDWCRVRFSVTVALGSLFVVPNVPGLVHTLTPGEAVQQIADPVSRVSQALLAAGTALAAQPALLAAGTALAPQPLALRTLSDVRPGSLNRFAADISVGAGISEPGRHVDLGDRSSFEVSAWLGSGVLEIPAPFAASGNQPSATIQVAADVRQSTAHFTGFAHDAALLLSDADPLGLVQTITRRVRQRSSLALLDDISLIGGPGTASVGHLDALVVDAFPCGKDACPLNVGATIVPGRVAARTAIAFIGSSRYGVVWSADAVKLLVRFCWENGGFPRNIMQTSVVHLAVDGLEQDAAAISVFHLDTLDAIEIEYDANGRRDVLYTRGTARVVPQFIRLNDGRQVIAKDPHDPVFAPSDPRAWAAFGGLTEQPLPASSPELLLFERAITNGMTIRLGRPFSEPPDAAVVTDSRLSAPAQRIALLVI
jgi:hypothetical protein